MNKRGISINELGPIAVLFIVAIVVLVIGANVLSSFSDNYATSTDVTTEKVTNDTTIAVINGSWSYLGHVNLVAGSEVIYNDTEATKQENQFNVTDDYNINYVDGTIYINDTTNQHNSQTFSNVSYHWTDRQSSYAYNNTQAGLSSIQILGNWLPTLAIVIVASIIIGTIMIYLYRRNQ
jgi:hypothetical protein